MLHALLVALALSQAPQALFSPHEAQDLNPKQKAVYDRVAALPTTASKPQVFTLNPKGTDINVKIDGVDINAQCQNKDGRLTSDNPMVAITVTKNYATGLIYHNKRVYAVEPLGDGKVIIFRLDQTKFKD